MIEKRNTWESSFSQGRGSRLLFVFEKKEQRQERREEKEGWVCFGVCLMMMEKGQGRRKRWILVTQFSWRREDEKRGETHACFWGFFGEKGGKWERQTLGKEDGLSHTTQQQRTHEGEAEGEKRNQKATEAKLKRDKSFSFVFFCFIFGQEANAKPQAEGKKREGWKEGWLEGRMDGGDVPVSREDAPWNQKATKQKASQEDGWVFFIVV